MPEQSIQICTYCAEKFPPGADHHCRLEGLNDAYKLVLACAIDSTPGYAWKVRIRAALLRAMIENPDCVMPGAAIRLEQLGSTLELARMATKDEERIGG